MPRLTRVALGLVVAHGFVCGTALARGWVEKTVLSDSATVDVERDGTAVVAHEILYGIRGGPLPELSFAPIDAGSELEDGATATLARSGTAAGFPIPLSGALDANRLALKVQVGKGLRSGTYLVRFRYRTSLSTSEKMRSTDSGTLIEWSGPSFSDGIDSARVVFRFPRARTPPRAPSQEGDGAAAVADDATGVFLTSVRRGTDKDEIEITRPHVAKGETVHWRALVDPGALDPASNASSDPLPVPKTVDNAAPKSRSVNDRPRTLVWCALALLAAAYGLVSALKFRWTRRACEQRRAHAKPLVPMPVALRATIAFLALAGAGAAVLETLPASIAAASLLLALLVGVHLPPRLSPPLRGPGEWIDMDPESALAERPVLRQAGRVLDVATPLGFVTFVACLAAFVACAVVVLRQSPYYGVALALSSSVLFPLFCTGRPTELPPSAAEAPVDLIEWLLAELGKDSHVVLGIIGRLPRGVADPDELRLRVMPKKPLPGLRAIEIGVDLHEGPLGAFTLPFVIVRTLDGSQAADALPKGLYVTRGRGVDERVAVLRPKVPTERVVARLVRDVVERLALDERRDAPRSHRERSASSSSGKPSSTANAGTVSSPVHAT